MNIVITGAFGNVGTSLLRELLPRKRHTVRCFDVKTVGSEKRSQKYADQVEIVWGDIRSADDVARALKDQDVVIHLAAIIPPKSDVNPDATRAINLGGTTNIVNTIKASSRPMRLIHASSLALFGATQHLPPPRTIDDPIQITDVYTETKAASEAVIKESGITYAILRFGAVLPIDAMGTIDPLMFELPLTDRMEYVHTYDVGLALANAIDTPAINGKTLLIGGGKPCQIYGRDIATRPMDALGIGALPDSAYGHTPFHGDWLDTNESQALLQYQRFTFDDYVRDVVKALGWRVVFIRLMGPLIRRRILSTSPHYRAQA